MRAAGLLLSMWLGLSFATPVQAWSAFGHRLVGLLAQEQLSDGVRMQVDELLMLESGADLGTIAAWADGVRGEPRYAHTGPLHYVNFKDGSCKYKARRDCPNGACVIDGLSHYTRILGDVTESPEARLEALKFVVHLVGDVHQPFHAGNRDDRGGNRFQVRVGKEGTNLHSAWDFHVLKSARLGMTGYRARLGPRVVTTSPVPMDFVAWAEESCALIDTEELYPARQGNLPAGYLKSKRPLAERQIVLAAARLAELLETTLGLPAKD